MNKYLKGFIGFVVILGIGLVGLAISITIVVLGSLFTPEVATRIYEVFGHIRLYPGGLLTCYVITVLFLFAFSLLKTLQLILVVNRGIKKMTNQVDSRKAKGGKR